MPTPRFVPVNIPLETFLAAAGNAVNPDATADDRACREINRAITGIARHVVRRGEQLFGLVDFSQAMITDRVLIERCSRLEEGKNLSSHVRRMWTAVEIEHVIRASIGWAAWPSDNDRFADAEILVGIYADHIEPEDGSAPSRAMQAFLVSIASDYVSDRAQGLPPRPFVDRAWDMLKSLLV